MSENGVIDPLTGYPAINAVLFKHGNVINLGTLPAGYESFGLAINDRGQVAGFSSNGTPDPFSMFGWGTQTRSFIWQNGVMTDLGTLGGPDSTINNLNSHGQIAGQSYTNSTLNPVTGSPTIDPFLWQDGHIRDLGTLGGTQGFVNWMNNSGEVVGFSNLAGDQTHHPYLWNGRRLLDLGTFGGVNGNANWISDAGDVVGAADLLGSHTHDAFLWRHGAMKDLGTANGNPCSHADSINNEGQIVGSTTDCHTNLAAVIWAHGSAIDLNTLIAPSTLHLTEAVYISDQGQIVGYGVLPNGDQHAYLLIPNNPDH